MADTEQRCRRLQITRPGVVVPYRVDPTGQRGPTRGQAAGPFWRATSRGRYVPSLIDASSVPQRIVEAGAALPAYGGVTGWAALSWAGGTWFTGDWADGTLRDIWLATSCFDIRPQSGYRISAERLSPRDLIVLDGLPVTTMVRSVLFEMRYAANLRVAVKVLDMAAFNDLVSIDDVASYAAAHHGWTGIPQARAAVGLAAENAWSPQEVETRLSWEVDAGLPPLLCNVPIFDRAGRHLLTPDLLEPRSGTALEYNGSVHLAGAIRAKDRDRDELMKRVGLEGVTFLAGDLPDRDRTVWRMRQAYARALRSDPLARGWTLEAPRWWRETSTVTARRALSAYDRARLLRHRRPPA